MVSSGPLAGVRVIRLRLQDRAVQLFRFRESTGLMVLHGLLQGGVEIHGSFPGIGHRGTVPHEQSRDLRLCTIRQADAGFPRFSARCVHGQGCARHPDRAGGAPARGPAHEEKRPAWAGLSRTSTPW